MAWGTGLYTTGWVTCPNHFGHLEVLITSCAHLREGGIFAQVQVSAEITAVANHLREHVGVAGVPELGLLREFTNVYQAK